MGQVPKLGALAVVIHQDQALLVQRKNPPDAGTWGYAGGHVEFGESFAEAAVRELHEETSVRATAVTLLDTAELIHRDADGAVTHHFVLGAVLCRYDSGVPVADDDAMDAAWVPLQVIYDKHLPMSDKVDEVARAAALFLKS
ncbi:NUDIX hydrolase [Pacificibacter marinus]|uniref:Diadenosine hexaphosphate hydrolase n=1 Tax=Pacificibacter marinus TaxID=658057 RepID=A0A1Y5RQE6_9RHOB|nr:NUDIX hydrolase [Pacificibacter marinus]SEK17589.1 ADP-ribose pyrophosphatase YjhB, NUDIX family [Pacificibacter marinus]SLN20042.1 Diadenosine hexaphosphate hydrolase [Pacificibacter marinus]